MHNYEAAVIWRVLFLLEGIVLLVHPKPPETSNLNISEVCNQTRCFSGPSKMLYPCLKQLLLVHISAQLAALTATCSGVCSSRISFRPGESRRPAAGKGNLDLSETLEVMDGFKSLQGRREEGAPNNKNRKRKKSPEHTEECGCPDTRGLTCRF